MFWILYIGFVSLKCGGGNRRARFCVWFSRVRSADVATDVLDSWIRVQGSLQVVVEKKVERCKGSMELSDSSARRVNKTEDSYSVMAILISTKTDPKDCWGGSWSHWSHVLPLHRA